MKSKTERTCDTVGNILQVTKNTIQLNENYYNYYINKDNSLYIKQLPLLVQKANMQAIAIKRKEDEKNYLELDALNKEEIMNQTQFPLNDIRNAQIRSKKLPPLCPFYSNKGELLRSVVTTSKIFNRQYLTDDFRTSPSPSKGIKIRKLNLSKKSDIIPITINFDEFQNDYFNEPEYASLTYKDYEIFGKKDYYIGFIKNKINEFKKLEIDYNGEFRKEKNFEKNKQKKNISLIFNSLSVKIYEIKKDQKENEDINDKRKKKNDEPIFEYNLPFAYLPLFYSKGEEKFKIFLSKIIQWDNINNKFILIENSQKAFRNILKHSSDFNKEEKKEEPKKEIKSGDEITTRSGKAKFSSTLGGKKTQKKETGFKFNPYGSMISIDEKALAQSMMAQNPSTYLTNLDDAKKRFDVVYQESIYPSKKEHNFINYNIFEFLWITPNKNFKVCISTPLASIIIPKNRIEVKKYIDFELLFFLYEQNFKNWDYYLVKYLSSFKSFRSLLEEINSINETYNKDFYLSHPRVKNYSFNNIKMVNIASIKQKHVLDNLIEELMGIPEEKKEEEHKEEKKKKEDSDIAIENKEEKSKENEKNGEEKDKKDENLQDNENKDENSKDKETKNENNNEGNEKEKESQNENKSEKEKENNEEIMNPNNDNPKEDLVNSTFVQKCFIAVVRFVDTKTFKANEYKIYFNFNQFQKFQKMEKYIDKISFLIKFIDINYTKKSVTIDYKSIDNFDENKWIKDYNQYNTQYITSIENKSNNLPDYHRMTAEYLGMTKNSVIQIEIYTPLSLARTLSEICLIKTEKIFMNNTYQDKAVNVEKDNILEMSKIFYDCYEEEQSKKT